jgi:citrate lyase subunit beta/citryl-CoA lyase
VIGRSFLYVPASNSRALEKAGALACDAVILDLEDAVAPEAKAEARKTAAAAAGGGLGGRGMIIRCNGLDTEWGEADLAAAALSGAHGVLAPKVRELDDVLAWDRWLVQAPPELELWAMIETAAAVMNLQEIAGAAGITRLRGLVLGSNDLGQELGLRTGDPRGMLQPICLQLVAAARACGLSVLGGTFNRLEDDAGFEADCRRDAECGFDGKTLIHPRQIEACNRIFSPTEAELAWARKVVEAFAAPEAAGKGVIRLEGRMVERLHLEQARRTLARPDA